MTFLALFALAVAAEALHVRNPSRRLVDGSALFVAATASAVSSLGLVPAWSAAAGVGLGGAAGFMVLRRLGVPTAGVKIATRTLAVAASAWAWSWLPAVPDPIRALAAAACTLLLSLLLAAYTARRSEGFREALFAELDHSRILLVASWVAGSGAALLWDWSPLGAPLLWLLVWRVQDGLRLLVEAEVTHRQSIRALGRVTDVAGYTPDSHGIRVAKLCYRVGPQVGVHGDALSALTNAALLHDLGQLELAEPLPFGATADLPSQTRSALAAASARLVRESARLEDTATIIEASALNPAAMSGPWATAGAVLSLANRVDELWTQTGSDQDPWPPPGVDIYPRELVDAFAVAVLDETWRR